jgi:hypothetical protein
MKQQQILDDLLKKLDLMVKPNVTGILRLPLQSIKHFV